MSELKMSSSIGVLKTPIRAYYSIIRNNQQCVLTILCGGPWYLIESGILFPPVAFTNVRVREGIIAQSAKVEIGCNTALSALRPFLVSILGDLR